MVTMFLGFVSSLLNIAMLFIAEGSTFRVLLDIVDLMLVIIRSVYRFRIYRNVAIMFQIKPRLLLLWLAFNSVVFCVLGFGRKYQPAWKMDDVRSDTQDFFSGVQAQVLDHGLTINLNKRSVRDLLKTKTLLRDVHIEIKPGRMVLLLGGSGAGKTTLLDAVIGYEKADA